MSCKRGNCQKYDITAIIEQTEITSVTQHLKYIR